MAIRRLEYRHICYRDRYNPALLSKAVDEALNVFLKKERGLNGHKFVYNEKHPLTIEDLREINNYVEKIWADEEIYYNDGTIADYWTDEGFGNENT